MDEQRIQAAKAALASGDIDAMYLASVDMHHLITEIVQNEEYQRVKYQGDPAGAPHFEGYSSTEREARAVWSALDQAMPREWPTRADGDYPWQKRIMGK